MGHNTNSLTIDTPSKHYVGRYLEAIDGAFALRKSGHALAGLCAGFLSFTAVYAQTATGTIRGTVSDPSEATVPDCTVSVRERQTNSIRTATSDTKGSFQIPLLPAGTYELTVQKQGFATYKRLNCTWMSTRRSICPYNSPSAQKARWLTSRVRSRCSKRRVPPEDR